jgi:hypothetical protein
MIIDTFSYSAGWGKAEGIIPDHFDGWEKALAEAGFELFDQLGRHQNGIQIHTRDNAYLVSIETPFCWREVYCCDLASLTGLLAQLEPWFRMTQATEMIEMIREIHELLVEYGETGPLEACLDRKARREAHYGQLREKK